jgi:hypothetical protein
VSPVGGEHVEGKLRFAGAGYSKRDEWNMAAALRIAEMLRMLIYPPLCFGSNEE